MWLYVSRGKCGVKKTTVKKVCKDRIMGGGVFKKKYWRANLPRHHMFQGKKLFYCGLQTHADRHLPTNTCLQTDACRQTLADRCSQTDALQTDAAHGQMHACIRYCVQTDTHTDACMHLSVCRQTHTQMHACICLCADRYTHRRIHASVCVQTDMHMVRRIHASVCVQTDTHTDACTLTRTHGYLNKIVQELSLSTDLEC